MFNERKFDSTINRENNAASVKGNSHFSQSQFSEFFLLLSKLLIVGQAPGIRVHKTGIPWNDPSGIASFMANLDRERFYDDQK
jgi:hypothetical protein